MSGFVPPVRINGSSIIDANDLQNSDAAGITESSIELKEKVKDSETAGEANPEPRVGEESSQMPSEDNVIDKSEPTLNNEAEDNKEEEVGAQSQCLGGEETDLKTGECIPG